MAIVGPLTNARSGCRCRTTAEFYRIHVLSRRHSGTGRGSRHDSDVGKSWYGYKLHANSDRRWGFIRKAEVTSAAEHDCTQFEQVLDAANTSRDVYADKGYAKAERERQLREQGYRAQIQRKATTVRELSATQKRRNQRIARKRAVGEHPFARLAQMGGKCVRTIGLARAKVQIGLKVAVHNLQRLARLMEAGVIPA